MALLSFDPLDPFGGLLSLQSELDRLRERPGMTLGLGGTVYPPINVFGDANGLVVRAEVPGIAADKLKVSVERRQLTISGERSREAAAGGSYHRRERPVGGFSRTVQLPEDLDPEGAAAECRDGMLTVRIPRHAAAKPRAVPVQSA